MLVFGGYSSQAVIVTQKSCGEVLSAHAKKINRLSPERSDSQRLVRKNGEKTWH